MNPDANSQNHFNLPTPVAEARPVADTEMLPAQAEQSFAAVPESAANTPAFGGPVASSQDDAQQLVNAQAQSALQAVAPVPQQAVPASGSDDDMALDKVWVLKAKQIVQGTTNDPYAQNRQLAQIKSDYLRQRYGKVVKLAE